jgi:2-keto-4-pentenoate hydratase
LRGQYRIVEGAGPTVAKTVADNIAEASFIIGQPDLSTI